MIKIVLIASFTILLNYAVSTLLLSNYCYTSIHLCINTHKTVWHDCQDKRLLTHRTFNDASLKPVGSRFHDCGTLIVSKPVGGRFHGCGILVGSKTVRDRFHGCGSLTSKAALDT